MTLSRKRRGMATQRDVANWFRAHGWPFATAKGAGEGGVDIENMIGLSPEVKATADDPILGGLRQAKKNAKEGTVPFVVWRPNGYGPERIGDWPMVFTVADGTALLRAAGYGDPT